MTELGFDVLPGDHPIVPVMVGDAPAAARLSQALVAHGVFAVAFSYPVVPLGTARIRTQMSAAHTDDDVDLAVRAFVAARDEIDSEAAPRCAAARDEAPDYVRAVPRR